jgi:O-antigen/teichoic acid export membrane protein
MLFIKSSLVVILAWYYAPIYGVKGVVIIEVVIFFLLAFTALYFNRPNFELKKILKGHILFRKTIKHGVPIMVANLIRNLTLNIDRWVLIGSLGVIALAKYAFAMILYQAGMVGISFISTILGTRWLADFGRDSSLDAMVSKIAKIMVFGSAISLLLAWPVLMLISHFVELYYQKYAGSDFNSAVIYIYFGVVFLMLSSLLDWLFIASSNEKLVLKISLYSLAITILLMVYCYLEADKIYIYALVFLVVRVFNFTASVFFIQRVLTSRAV